MKAETNKRAFGPFKVWTEPAVDRFYIVGVDTAEGKVRDRPAFARASLTYRDSKPDYSAAVVIDRETGRHCATWQGDIEVTDWSYVVAAIGYYYNKAMLVPEVNGPGNEVVNTLARRVKYPNLYRNQKPFIQEGDDITPKWGWFTTNWNRDRLFARGAEILANDPHCVADKDLVDEIRTIEVDETGKPRAKHPNKDDRVLAWIIALQARWEWMTGQLGRPEKEEDPLAVLPQEDADIWRTWQDHCGRIEEKQHGPEPVFRGMRNRRTVRFGRRGLRPRKDGT